LKRFRPYLHFFDEVGSAGCFAHRFGGKHLRIACRPLPVQFALELPMRYKASFCDETVSGVSRTRWIGSKEIAFSAGADLQEHMRAVISIAWPFLLENRVRLQLSIEGVVTRIEEGVAVTRISNYHFRTRGDWESAAAPILDSRDGGGAPPLSLAAGATAHA
jgi:hypothetical protein